MKWIGQNIWDEISRFRNHTYFEDNITLSTGKSITMDEYTSGTISITKIQDSGTSFNSNDTSLLTAAAIANKIEAYGFSTATGDITAVTITTDSGGGSAASDTGGSADFSILGSSGVGVTNSGTTITVVAVPAEIDHNSLNNYSADYHFTQNSITEVGTIGGGVWQGTAIASAYLDADTAHLSGTQTFTGEKTFDKVARAVFDGNKSVTPGDGAMIHVDTCTITDSDTSASGNAALYTHVKLEGPTLAATNADVTTDDAATLYVLRASSGTNQTITNNWGVYVEGPTRTESITNAGSYSQTTGDMTLYDATNNGNPTISLGSSATERLEIKAEYESGAQGLDVVKFISHTAGSAANDARFAFEVDETSILQIKDAGLNLTASMNLSIGNTDILADSSGTTTLSNIDAIDATTESTIESAIDTLSNLTTVGTIATGVWQGPAVATDQQKHLAWFVLRGYGTGDGTNYEIPEIMSDTNAPFEHNTSAGSDGLTAQAVNTMMRLGGVVVPRAGTLKKWYGWATTAGSSTSNIGLFRVRPTRNDNSNLTPVLLDNFSYTALGNTKMEDFSETSFTDADIAAGDIIYTGIKCENNKTTYFTSTLEIEWD
jgi:hypothetical protein